MAARCSSDDQELFSQKKKKGKKEKRKKGKKIQTNKRTEYLVTFSAMALRNTANSS
jgi:hypothetical protein